MAKCIFHENQIHIKKTCASPVTCSTFFITKDDEACDCGFHPDDKLGIQRSATSEIGNQI